MCLDEPSFAALTVFIYFYICTRPVHFFVVLHRRSHRERVVWRYHDLSSGGGTEPAHIRSVGMGESRRVERLSAEEGRQMNRREEAGTSDKESHGAGCLH